MCWELHGENKLDKMSIFSFLGKYVQEFKFWLRNQALHSLYSSCMLNVSGFGYSLAPIVDAHSLKDLECLAL